MSRGQNFSMYALLSSISYIVRWIACYFTIGQISLFENAFLNFVIPDVIIYILIMTASHWTVRAVIYNKLDIHDKYVGCAAYFITYFPYMLLMWFILSILTWAHILPIHI